MYLLIAEIIDKLTPFIGTLMSLHYFIRRRTRLTGVTARRQKYPVVRIISIALPVGMCYLVGAVLVDGVWDQLRHTYSLPVQDYMLVTVIKLANAGMFTGLLVLMIGVVEVYDRFR